MLAHDWNWTMTEGYEPGDCCPISDDQSDIESKALSFGPRRVRPDEFDSFVDKESARARARQLGCIGIRQYDSTTGGVVWLPCSNESDYRRVTGASPLGRRQRRRILENEIRNIMKGKALGPSIGDMRRDMNPATAIDADKDRIVLEGIPSINMGRGVPDPTPFGADMPSVPKRRRQTRVETPQVEEASQPTPDLPRKRRVKPSAEAIRQPKIEIPPLSDAVKPRVKPKPDQPKRPAVKYRDVNSQIADLVGSFSDPKMDLYSIPKRELSTEASRRLEAMAFGHSPASRVNTGTMFLRSGDSPEVANVVAFSREIGSQKANVAASDLTSRIAQEKTRLDPSAKNVAGGSAMLLSKLLSSENDSDMLRSDYSFGTSDLFSDRYVSSLGEMLASGRMPRLATYINESFGQTQNGNRLLSYMLGLSDASLTKLRKSAVAGLLKPKPSNSPNGILDVDSDPFELASAALLARRFLLNHSENFGPDERLWSAVDEMTGSNESQTNLMFSNMLGKNSDLLTRIYDGSRFVSSYGNNLLRLARSVTADMVDTDWDDIRAIELAKDLSGDGATGSMASYYPMERRQPGKWSPIVSRIQDQISQNDYMAAVGRGLPDETISRPDFFDASFGDLVNETATLLSVLRDRAEWGLLPWREYANGWLDDNQQRLDLDEFDPADMRSLFDSRGKKLPLGLYKSIGMLTWAASSLVNDDYTMPSGRKTTLEERESVLDSLRAIAEAWGNTLLPEYSKLSLAKGPRRKPFTVADPDDAKIAQERDDAISQASQELVAQLKAATTQKIRSGAAEGPSAFASEFVDSFAEVVERLSLDKYATDEVFSNIASAMEDLAEATQDRSERKRMRNVFPSILDAIRDSMSADDDELSEVVGRTLNSSAPRIARRRTQRRAVDDSGVTGFMGTRPQPKKGAREGAMGIQKLPPNWVSSGGVQEKFDPIDQVSRDFWTTFASDNPTIVNRLNAGEVLSPSEMIIAMNRSVGSLPDTQPQSISFDWQRDWTRKALATALRAEPNVRTNLNSVFFGTIPPSFDPPRSNFPNLNDKRVRDALRPFSLSIQSTSWGLRTTDYMTGRTISGLHKSPRDDKETNAANALGNIMWAFLEGPQSVSKYTGMPGDEMAEGSPIGNEYEYSFNSWLRNPFNVAEMPDGKVVGIRLAKGDNQTSLRNSFRQLVHDLWDAAEAVSGSKIQGRPGPVYPDLAVNTMSSAVEEVEGILKSYSVNSQTMSDLAEKVSVVMRHRHGRIPDEVGELWNSLREFSSLDVSEEADRLDDATTETISLATKAGISLVLGQSEDAVDAMSPNAIGAAVAARTTLSDLYNEIRDVFSPNSVMSLRDYREDASHSTRNFIDLQTNNFVTSDKIRDAIESVYPGFHDGYLRSIADSFGAAGFMGGDLDEQERISRSMDVAEQKDALEKRKYVRAVYELESVDDLGESLFKVSEWKREQLVSLADSSDWFVYAAIGGFDPLTQFVSSSPNGKTTFVSARNKLRSFLASTSAKNIDAIFDNAMRKLGILPEGLSSVPQRTSFQDFSLPNSITIENSVYATTELVAALRSGVLQAMDPSELPEMLGRNELLAILDVPESWPVPLTQEDLDLIPSPREVSRLAKDMVALDRRQMLEFLGSPETGKEIAGEVSDIATGVTSAVRKTAQFLPTEAQRAQNESLEALRGSDDQSIEAFVGTLSVPQLERISEMPRNDAMKDRLAKATGADQVRNLVVSSTLKAQSLNLTDAGKALIKDRLAEYSTTLTSDSEKNALGDLLKAISSGDVDQSLDALSGFADGVTGEALNELMRLTYESFGTDGSGSPIDVKDRTEEMSKRAHLENVAKAALSGEDYESTKKEIAKILTAEPVDGVGYRMVIVSDPSLMDSEKVRRNSELSAKLSSFDGSLDQAREIVSLMTDDEVSSLVRRRIIPLLIQKQMHDAWQQRILTKANSQLDARLRQIGRRMRNLKAADGMSVGDVMNLVDEAVDQAFEGRAREMLSVEELAQFGDIVAYFVAGGREILPKESYRDAIRSMRLEAKERVNRLIRRWRKEEDEKDQIWEDMMNAPMEQSVLELLRATSTPKTREQIAEEMERDREERYGRRPNLGQKPFEGEDPGLTDDSFWQMFEPKPSIRGDDYGDTDITGFMAGEQTEPDIEPIGKSLMSDEQSKAMFGDWTYTFARTFFSENVNPRFSMMVPLTADPVMYARSQKAIDAMWRVRSGNMPAIVYERLVDQDDVQRGKEWFDDLVYAAGWYMRNSGVDVPEGYDPTLPQNASDPMQRRFLDTMAELAALALHFDYAVRIPRLSSGGSPFEWQADPKDRPVLLAGDYHTVSSKDFSVSEGLDANGRRVSRWIWDPARSEEDEAQTTMPSVGRAPTIEEETTPQEIDDGTPFLSDSYVSGVTSLTNGMIQALFGSKYSFDDWLSQGNRYSRILGGDHYEKSGFGPSILDRIENNPKALDMGRILQELVELEDGTERGLRSWISAIPREPDAPDPDFGPPLPQLKAGRVATEAFADLSDAEIARQKKIGVTSDSKASKDARAKWWSLLTTGEKKSIYEIASEEKTSDGVNWHPDIIESGIKKYGKQNGLSAAQVDSALATANKAGSERLMSVARMQALAVISEIANEERSIYGALSRLDEELKHREKFHKETAQQYQDLIRRPLQASARALETLVEMTNLKVKELDDSVAAGRKTKPEALAELERFFGVVYPQLVSLQNNMSRFNKLSDASMNARAAIEAEMEEIKKYIRDLSKTVGVSVRFIDERMRQLRATKQGLSTLGDGDPGATGLMALGGVVVPIVGRRSVRNPSRRRLMSSTEKSFIEAAKGLARKRTDVGIPSSAYDVIPSLEAMRSRIVPETQLLPNVDSLSSVASAMRSALNDFAATKTAEDFLREKLGDRFLTFETIGLRSLPGKTRRVAEDAMTEGLSVAMDSNGVSEQDVLEAVRFHAEASDRARSIILSNSRTEAAKALGLSVDQVDDAITTEDMQKKLSTTISAANAMARKLALSHSRNYVTRVIGNKFASLVKDGVPLERLISPSEFSKSQAVESARNAVFMSRRNGISGRFLSALTGVNTPLSRLIARVTPAKRAAQEPRNFPSNWPTMTFGQRQEWLRSSEAISSLGRFGVMEQMRAVQEDIEDFGISDGPLMAFASRLFVDTMAPGVSPSSMINRDGISPMFSAQPLAQGDFVRTGANGYSVLARRLPSLTEISDEGLARFLNAKDSLVRQFRNGQTFLTNDAADRVAEAFGLPAAELWGARGERPQDVQGHFYWLASTWDNSGQAISLLDEGVPIQQVTEQVGGGESLVRRVSSLMKSGIVDAFFDEMQLQSISVDDARNYADSLNLRKRRDAIMLLASAGYTEPEIVSATNFNPNTVRNVLREARSSGRAPASVGSRAWINANMSSVRSDAGSGMSKREMMRKYGIGSRTLNAMLEYGGDVTYRSAFESGATGSMASRRFGDEANDPELMKARKARGSLAPTRDDIKLIKSRLGIDTTEMGMDTDMMDSLPAVVANPFSGDVSSASLGADGRPKAFPSPEVEKMWAEVIGDFVRYSFSGGRIKKLKASDWTSDVEESLSALGDKLSKSVSEMIQEDESDEIASIVSDIFASTQIGSEADIPESKVGRALTLLTLLGTLTEEQGRRLADDFVGVDDEIENEETVNAIMERVDQNFESWAEGMRSQVNAVAEKYGVSGTNPGGWGSRVFLDGIDVFFMNNQRGMEESPGGSFELPTISMSLASFGRLIKPQYERYYFVPDAMDEDRMSPLARRDSGIAFVAPPTSEQLGLRVNEDDLPGVPRELMMRMGGTHSQNVLSSMSDGAVPSEYVEGYKSSGYFPGLEGLLQFMAKGGFAGQILSRMGVRGDVLPDEFGSFNILGPNANELPIPLRNLAKLLGAPNSSTGVPLFDETDAAVMRRVIPYMAAADAELTRLSGRGGSTLTRTSAMLPQVVPSDSDTNMITAEAVSQPDSVVMGLYSPRERRFSQVLTAIANAGNAEVASILEEMNPRQLALTDWVYAMRSAMQAPLSLFKYITQSDSPLRRRDVSGRVGYPLASESYDQVAVGDRSVDLADAPRGVAASTPNRSFYGASVTSVEPSDAQPFGSEMAQTAGGVEISPEQDTTFDAVDDQVYSYAMDQIFKKLAKYNSSAAESYVDNVLNDEEVIRRAVEAGASQEDVDAALEKTKSSIKTMSRILSDLLADSIVYDAAMSEAGTDASRAPFDATRTVSGRWLDAARPRRDTFGYWSMYGPDVVYALPGEKDPFIPEWGNFIEDENSLAASRLSSRYEERLGAPSIVTPLEEEIAEALERTPTRYWWDARPGLVSEFPDGEGRTLLNSSDYLPNRRRSLRAEAELGPSSREINFESPLSLAQNTDPNQAVLNMNPEEFQNYVWSLSETLSGRRSEESGVKVTAEVPEIVKAAFGDLKDFGYENIPYDKLDEWAGTIVAELNPKDVTPERVVAELTNVFPYLNANNKDDSYPVSGFTFDEAIATLHDRVGSTMSGEISDRGAVRPMRGEGYATIFGGADTPANRRLRASSVMSSAKAAIDDLRSRIDTNTRALFAIREAVKNLTSEPSQRFVNSVKAIRELHNHATKLAQEGQINAPTLFRINNELMDQLMQVMFADPRIGNLLRNEYSSSMPDIPANRDEGLSGYATIWDRLIVGENERYSSDASAMFPDIAQIEDFMTQYEDRTGDPYEFLPKSFYDLMSQYGVFESVPEAFAEDENLLEILGELNESQRKIYSELRLDQKSLANIGIFGSSVTLGEVARRIDEMTARNKMVAERYKLLGRYKQEVIDPAIGGIDDASERMRTMKTFKQWLSDSGYSSLLENGEPDDFGAAGNMALSALVASRFTDDSRISVLNAADEVRGDDSKFMTSGHLLIGAWRQLEAPNVVPGLKSLLEVADVSKLRAALAESIKTAGKTRKAGESPLGFSKNATKALQNSIVAAAGRSTEFIELQDLIGALLNPSFTDGKDDGIAEALSAADISVADILARVQAATSGFGTEYGAAGAMSSVRARDNRKNAVKERTRARLAYDSAWFNREGRSTSIDDRSLVDEVERLSDLYVAGINTNTLSEYDFMGGESPMDQVAPRPFNSVVTYGELGQRPTDLVGAIRDAMLRADALVVSDAQRSRLNSIGSKLKLLFDNYMHVEAMDEGVSGSMADGERTLADMMEPVENLFARSEKRDQKAYYSGIYGPAEETFSELQKSARLESLRSPFTIQNNTSYDPDDISWSTNDWVYRKDGSFIEGADAVIMRMRDGDIGTAEVAMISRKSGPFRGALSTVGGLRDGDEDLMTTATREAAEEVGLPEEQITEAIPLGVIESPDWDPRFINGVRVGGGLFMVPWGTELSAASDATAAQWVPLEEIASGRHGLGFGHAEWLRRAVASMNVNPASDPFSEIRLSIAKRLSILSKVARLRNQRMIAAINDVRRATGRPLFMDSDSMPHPMMPWGNRVARSVWEFGKGETGNMSESRPQVDNSLAERLQIMDVASGYDSSGYKITPGELSIPPTYNFYGVPSISAGSVTENARKSFLDPTQWDKPTRASQLWIPYVDRSIAIASASTALKQEIPRMWVLGGPSGSGKTTIRNNGLFGVPNYDDAVVVDPDDAKIITPEFRSWVPMGVSNAAALLHEESRMAGFALYGSALDMGMDIVYDSSGQFRDGNSLSLAKQKGYKIVGYYAFAPMDTLLNNVEDRARRTGRSVDEGTIKAIASNLSSVIPAILHYFDELYILDTERGVEKPMIVGKYAKDAGWDVSSVENGQQIGVLQVVRPTMFRYVYKDMKSRAREISSLPVTWQSSNSRW